MNKFTAWDKFKQKSIKSKVVNKKSVPSALRKIFINRLISENAEICGNFNIDKKPVFTSLIKTQWAGQAQHFSAWLTGILPQLGVWFKQCTSKKYAAGLSIDSILGEEAEKAASLFEGDDRDMFVLARRYAQFLDKHSLFEPAWETPPFNNDNKKCFIFFPEALSDFREYRDLLSASSHVKIISGENTDNLMSHTFYYTNSRREITEAALYIRALHEKRNIAWDNIAVCLPDSEFYEPYTLREFSNRNIPYVKRISKPLTDFPAGQFFRSVISCSSDDFSFSAFIGLALNKNLPWKDEEKINNLVSFGIKNNCICSWPEDENGKEKHINVWEDAFKNPFDYLDDESRRYFFTLKKNLHALRNAKSFSALRKQYFIFRELFFDMDNCSEETDIVLSRCISELSELTELEKQFPDVPALDPFLFLTEYLSEVNYLAQPKTTGVAILPYKTAAAAPFDCHIILGAAQSSISVVYSHLNFLPKKKRDELGITDEDASAAFINFHKFNSRKISAFFCSEHAFSGYEIAHSKINAPLKPKDSYSEDDELCEYFSADYYRNENDIVTSENPILHEYQKKGFLEWKNRRKQSISCEKPVPNQLLEYIHKKAAWNPAYKDKIGVSASSLKTYYQCSLKWLFDRIFCLENAEIETSLVAENISGTVYHTALDMFFTKFAESGEALPKPEINEQNPSLPPSFDKLLKDCINSLFNCLPSLPLNETKTAVQMSSLTARFLKASKDQFIFNLQNFLSFFLCYFAGCRIKSCEKWYQTQKDNFYLTGKTDCILEDKNGNYIIVDFKLGSPPARKDCAGNTDNGLCDFQLPMYITLTEENEKIEIKTALFFSIIYAAPEVIFGRAYDELNEISIPKKDEDCIYRQDETYNLIFEEFDKKAKQYADEIESGNFTVFETDFEACYKCEFSRICRKVYIINGEKNLSLGKR